MRSTVEFAVKRFHEDITPESNKVSRMADDGLVVKHEDKEVKLVENVRQVRDVPSGYSILMPPSLIKSPVDN